MTHFENAVSEFKRIDDQLDSLAAEAHAGELEPAHLTDLSLEVREMVQELEKIQEAMREVLGFLEKANEVRL